MPPLCAQSALRYEELGGAPDCAPSGSIRSWLIAKLTQLIDELSTIFRNDCIYSRSKKNWDFLAQLKCVRDTENGVRPQPVSNFMSIQAAG
jgi:hypothetical protein